jgi:hypothetical protein
MQGFGSQGCSPGEADGLDALMASLGSGLGTARSALASAKSAALPALGSAVTAVRASETLGSVAERARRAAAIARGRLEEATSFNAQRDLAHLSVGQRHGGAGEGGGSGGGAGGGPGGYRTGGPAGDAAEQDSLGFGAVAGSVLSAGLGLWGLARAVVDEAVTFDAAADLAHLARPSREAAAAAAGVFGGFGPGDESASPCGSDGSPGWGQDEDGSGGARLAGATDGPCETGGGTMPGPVAHDPRHWQQAIAPDAQGVLAADGWNDGAGGWDVDEAEPARAVAPAQAEPHPGSMAPIRTASLFAAKPFAAVPSPAKPSLAKPSAAMPPAAKPPPANGDGWNDTSWADADDW